MADIFISHSGKDSEVAAAIGERIRLERPSWSLFYDKDNIRAGQRWQERLREELQSCRMVVALLSRNWLASPWCFTEAVTASFRGKDVVAIETEDLTSDDLARAPPILHERQRVRLREGDDRAFQELLEALDRSGLDPNDWFPIPNGVGPYPGLVAFDEKDAGVFFGRKQEITEYLSILDTLRGPDRAQVLVMSGASGSGKSSVLRAGLIPRLRRKPEWIVISPFEVARDPVRNLLDRLGEALTGVGIPTHGLDLSRPPDDAGILAQTLDEALRQLERAAGAWVLLPLDQAEALVAGVRPEGDPARLLLDALAQVLARRTRHVVIAATIRTEFVPRLEAIFAGPEVRLWQAPLIAIGSLAEIIEKPADRFGLELEPGLSERIVEDVHTSNALPLLAYTLKALSDRCGRDRRLTLDAYETLGGVQGAIAAKLSLVLSDPEPTAEEVAALQRAFTRYLIRVDEGAVEGERRLRRVVRRTRLPQASARLIGRLVDAGLLMAKDGTIELAHESVIGDWPKLPIKTWLAQDAADRRLIDQLRQRVDDDALPDGLFSQAGELLQRDLQLAVDEPEVATLVQRSRDQKRAREQRRRLVFSGVVLVALVFAGLAGVAWVQWGEAINQTQLANSAKERADENAKAASLATQQAEVERDRARMRLLATQARRVVAEADTTENIERAAALALESIEIARKRNRPAEAEAVEIGRIALTRLPLQVSSHGGPLRSLKALADGRLASRGEYDDQINLWPRDDVGKPVILRHGSIVRSLVELKDGRLASAGSDGRIKLWPPDGVGEPVILSEGSDPGPLAALPDGRLASSDFISGKITVWPRDGLGKPVVLSHTGGVGYLVTLADGRLASGGGDKGQITLWPRDGVSKPLILPHGGRLVSLVPLADGRLASGSEDGQIKLWPRDGVGTPVIISHSGRLVSLVALADGQLASGREDGQIKRWPRDGVGEPVTLSHGGQLSSLVALRDGRLASHGNYDDQIKLWPRDGAGEPLIVKHGGPVQSVVELADGRLASGGADGQIKRWPPDGAGEPVIIPHGVGAFDPLVALADGRLASAGLVDGQIKLWPRDGVGEPMTLSHGSGVGYLVALADHRLVSGGGGGQIKLWPRDGVGKPVILAHGSPLVSLVALADGRLASGSKDGQIKLWPQDGVGQPVIIPNGGPVQRLVALADGRLASGSEDGQIKLWPRDGMGQPVILAHGSPLVSLVALADGRLASGSNDGQIKLWPRDGVGEPAILSHGKGLSSLVALADGRLASADTKPIVAWANDDAKGQIKLWPRDGVGQPVIIPNSANLFAPSVALADGRLANGHSNGQIKLWPRDGVGDPVILSHGGQVLSLVELADGRLASASGDNGQIKLWLVDEDKLIAAICLRAGRNLAKDEWVQFVGSDAPRQPSCRNRPSNWRTPDH